LAATSIAVKLSRDLPSAGVNADLGNISEIINDINANGAQVLFENFRNGEAL